MKHRLNNRLNKVFYVIFLFIFILSFAAPMQRVFADWVGTAVNRVIVDPESLPVITDGYDLGDEVSFILETTPADTGSEIGAVAWMLVYMPDGVEVVGAELVSPDGDGTYSAIPAEDASPMSDDCGNRGCKFPTAETPNGDDSHINEIQQDTGIFYSTDARNALIPGGISPQIDPTGVVAQTVYNQWDYDQTLAFGIGAALSGNDGKGVQPLIELTPGDGTWYGTGSPVAGPDVYYTNDYNPACNYAIGANDFEKDIKCVGPWQRIKYDNAKFGGSGPITPATVGTTTLVNTAVLTTAGHDLSSSNPLPGTTKAVRFVQGERRLGDIENGRITFKITDAAAFYQSVFVDRDLCLDANGGDTDKPGRGAQDNPWRYYESNNHTCFEGSSDGVLIKQVEFVNGISNPGTALSLNDIIGFAITFTNTSGAVLYDIDLSDDLTGFTAPLPNLDLVDFTDTNCPYTSYDGDQGGLPTLLSRTATLATWNRLDTLAVDASVTVHMCGKVTGSTAGDEVRNLASVDFATTDEETQETQTSETHGTVATLIAGTVYLDADQSGTFTTGETGIANVSVQLYQDNGVIGTYEPGTDVLLSTHVTNAAGYYQFNNSCYAPKGRTGN